VTALLSTAHLVDLALALLVAESLLLAHRHRRGRTGIPARDLLPNMLAGAALLAALRLALADAPWYWLLTALAVALAAHLADLRRRLSHAA